MGSCFGRCFPQPNTSPKFNIFSNRTKHSRVEFSPLVEEDAHHRHENGRPSSSNDIQLQCLDARALLMHTTTSTPASSIDLEWEHESLPISMIRDPSNSSWTVLPTLYSQCPSDSSIHGSISECNTNSDWSRVPSSNSLEWDSVHNSLQISPIPSDVDIDTQLLLSEIERLTSQTLLETGQDICS